MLSEARRRGRGNLALLVQADLLSLPYRRRSPPFSPLVALPAYAHLFRLARVEAMEVGRSSRLSTGGFKRSSQQLDVEELRFRTRRRRADRAGRARLRSPGRPPVARREHRRWFWEGITNGLLSEDAGRLAGVSQAVATRWFRQGGGMPSIGLGPLSRRYLSFAKREEIAVLTAHGQKAVAPCAVNSRRACAPGGHCACQELGPVGAARSSLLRRSSSVRGPQRSKTAPSADTGKAT